MKIKINRFFLIIALISFAYCVKGQTIYQSNFEDSLQLIDFIGENTEMFIQAQCSTSGLKNSYLRFSVDQDSNIDLNIGFGPGTTAKLYVGDVLIFGPFLCEDSIFISDLNIENLTFPDYLFRDTLTNSTNGILNFNYNANFDAGNYIIEISSCFISGPLYTNMTFTNTGDPIYGEIDCTQDTLTFCDLYPLLCDTTSGPPCDHVILTVDSIDCPTCIGRFAPKPGKLYMFEAWVREEDASRLDTDFTDPKIKLRFFDGFDVLIGSAYALGTSGPIIEGWQQISDSVKIPDNAIRMEMELYVETGDAYFDDIRVSPFNSAMKTYVYDQQNMRLEAEMDERNFATYYQYDNEGRLVAVKKETARGIKTIQAVQQNTSTNNGQ